MQTSTKPRDFSLYLCLIVSVLSNVGLGALLAQPSKRKYINKMIRILEWGQQIYCVISHERKTVALSSVRKTRKGAPITLCMTWSTLRTTSKHRLITCVVWPLMVRPEPGIACRL